MRYAIAMYKKNRTVLLWDPAEKYFMVIDLNILTAELYERLIPSCCVTVTDKQERYEKNCEILAEELLKTQAASYDEILEILKSCDGTDQSVFGTCNKLSSTCNHYGAYMFLPVPADYESLLKY